jgi:hypothetical protein
VNHRKLTDDELQTKNLDLLPAGMIIKLRGPKIRVTFRNRNRKIKFVLDGQIVEIHVRRIVSS